jgi:hypothetical protein
MDWGRAEQDYLAELGQRPVARPPATFSEIVSGAWAGSGLDTLMGTAQPTADAYDEMVEAVAKETGKSLREFTDDWNGTGMAPMDKLEQARIVAERIAALDKGARDRLAPMTDIQRRAKEKAQAIEERAADIGERTYGLSGNALWFLIGLARQVIEPVNLGTIPLGGPLKGPVLKMIGREIVLGAGSQAIQEPVIQSRRAGFGLESGVGRAAGNVATAGVGAAGLSVILRGAAVGLRRLRGPSATADARARVSRPDSLSPDDMDAAAALAERDQISGAQAVPPTAAGRDVSARATAEAEAAIETGRLPLDEPVQLAGPEPVAPTPMPATTFTPRRLVAFENDTQQVIRPGGERLAVRPAVVELSDLTVSHDLEGARNPKYPKALQPRDREAAASQTFIAERAANLEPELLGRSPTASQGAPIVGPDLTIESGNGRALMIETAYARHPERAAAYRQSLEAQGYDVAGFERPVLVRIRETKINRAAFARESNVSPVAGMSARERAFADAGRLDDQIMGLWTPGETGSAANAKFVRAFADRVVAPEERPQFVGADDRLSIEGAKRVEAALVARAWGSKEIVTALFEETDPTSKAILGALADASPTMARLKSAVAEGRVPGNADPAPAIIAALRLVDRARSARQPVAMLLDQVDIEKGAVPDAVRAAVRLFFRDDGFRLIAGRATVAARIEKETLRALGRQDAVGDLFGAVPDVAAGLRAAKLVGEVLDDQPLPGTAAADMTAPSSAALGDPNLAADAERALAEIGADFEIRLVDRETGDTVQISARQALADAEARANAAREMADCVGGLAKEAA